MKFLIFLLLAPVMVFGQPANKQADSLFNRLMKVSRPQIKNWVYSTATKYRNKDVNKTILQSNNEFGVLGNMNGADIEALAFLVMMQASKEAENDMKTIMANVKATNDAKSRLRQQSQKIDSLKKKNQDNKDNIGDISQMDQMRLQMLTDRRQKMLETLSNMMKKISETESQITQNIK